MIHRNPSGSDGPRRRSSQIGFLRCLTWSIQPFGICVCRCELRRLRPVARDPRSHVAPDLSANLDSLGNSSKQGGIGRDRQSADGWQGCFVKALCSGHPEISVESRLAAVTWGQRSLDNGEGLMGFAPTSLKRPRLYHHRSSSGVHIVLVLASAPHHRPSFEHLFFLPQGVTRQHPHRRPRHPAGGIIVRCAHATDEPAPGGPHRSSQDCDSNPSRHQRPRVIIMMTPAAMVTWGFVHQVDVTDAHFSISGELPSYVSCGCREVHFRRGRRRVRPLDELAVRP